MIWSQIKGLQWLHEELYICSGNDFRTRGWTVSRTEIVRHLALMGFEYRQLIRVRRELRDLRLIHLAISTTNHSINQAKMIKPNTLARNMGNRLTLASYDSCKSAPA